MHGERRLLTTLVYELLMTSHLGAIIHDFELRSTSQILNLDPLPTFAY